jgi:hypothetical protein
MRFDSLLEAVGDEPVFGTGLQSALAHYGLIPEYVPVTTRVGAGRADWIAIGFNLEEVHSCDGNLLAVLQFAGCQGRHTIEFQPRQSKRRRAP